ncbi:chloramphenicol phosphotransferase CPT family protein [Rudaeicoccus suwonensis]|uniref:Chloramphenicol 3-O phosphotransferase n=1 Tax=Rudaeicoccus suwonensis TaxID=657409 RepID=A0A561E494_9MICO|nr:chloramphenicol phosphotransferase [Rudaeicoccus suwonensis]TWE10400.1 chloramphenicol 3-O phosphotransferase [Rudaeicoccus suwonensis]
MAGQVIVLNGSPRAGKSSIATAIQESFPGVWMNVGLDTFKNATPEKFQPGIGLRPGGERPDLEPLVMSLYLAMYESIAAHTRRGVNVVADTTHHDSYSRPLNVLAACASIVADVPVLFVGVRCPIDVVMQRRIATWGSGYEADGSIPPPVLRWQEAVHRSWTYDMEVDSSRATPKECATAISDHLATGQPGTAFKNLAGVHAARPESTSH